MFKEKSILFISEYSKENLFLAEQICENKKSITIFWENEESKSSKSDYFDVLDISNDLSEKFFIVSSNKESERFILLVSDILLKTNCDLIITKGKTSEIWPVSLIKDYYKINTSPFFAIVDGVDRVDDFDITTLRSFDHIFGIGKSCLIKEIGRASCRERV